MSFKLCVIVIVLAVTGYGDCKSKKASPPHCTTLTKDTDYAAKFRYAYKTMYIQQGQRNASEKLYCVNPPEVNKAVTTICDWVAPPRVQYTLGDEFVNFVRQDPTGKFQGAAVITTMQLCSHNINNDAPVMTMMAPDVTQLN